MDLAEVRKNIDRVDGEIRKLFIERMALAEQVACIKAETADEIYKPDREQAIINKQSAGIDQKLVMEYKALVKRIMEVSRKYQYGRTLELRDCFPFEYEQTPFRPGKLAMVKEEYYVCKDLPENYIVDTVRIPKETGTSQTVLVDSCEDIAACISNGRADAGMGIIETVGVNVSDELNLMLAQESLFIYDSMIQEYGGLRQKIVMFTDHLTVLPGHNRLKLLFECPNRSGSLGSILSMISDYGVNLTEIHSRPFRREDDWNYMFFVELAANLGEKEIRALLFQLSCETARLQILGSYRCEGDF